MTYMELVKKVASVTDGVSQRVAREVIDNTLTVIGNALCEGDDVALFRFGKFKVANVPEREVKSFGADKPTVCEAHNIVKFKPAATLKEAVH